MGDNSVVSSVKVLLTSEQVRPQVANLRWIISGIKIPASSE